MQILTNQMGYVSGDYKKAVFQGTDAVQAGDFQVFDKQKHVVYEGESKFVGAVAHWNTGTYWTMDFTALKTPGMYTIGLNTSEGMQYSFPFEITEYFQDMRMLNAVSYYFKAQRDTGEWKEADSHLKFEGSREGEVCVPGGWMDATGDYGIHMSHLSYSQVCNPQQAGFSAYVFFKAVENLLQSQNREYSMLIRRMLDEGTYGADYIMRMRAPSGTFYRSKGRRNALAATSENRRLALEGPMSREKGPVEDKYYEIGMRAGGGTCFAALAAAARHPYPGTEFYPQDYLMAAKEAFAYLWDNNEMYCGDGAWNLVDEYCALLAASELYASSHEYDYLDKAEILAKRMLGRMVPTGGACAWFTSRPGEMFCHAADEGLPVVALLTFAKLEPSPSIRKEVLTAVEKAFNHVLAVTDKVNNPFGYARYYHSLPDGGQTDKFFFYHTSPAAPWWQGDNARISSLAAAAWMAAPYVSTEMAERLGRFATDQLNWIMGLNPFDACMIEGYGRNNIQYFFQNRYDFMNCPGGICNGITSRMDDEDGILFVTEPTAEVNDNWRWAEQWLPHGTWYIYALSQKQVRSR